MSSGKPLKSDVSKTYLPFIQWLRGLSVLLVLYFHWVVLWCFYPDYVREVAGVPGVHVAANFPFAAVFSIDTGAPGITLFFLISGFVIPLSLEGINTRTFLWRRLVRIFPLHWLVLVTVYLAWNFVFRGSLPVTRQFSTREWLA